MQVDGGRSKYRLTRLARNHPLYRSRSDDSLNANPFPLPSILGRDVADALESPDVETVFVKGVDVPLPFVCSVKVLCVLIFQHSLKLSLAMVLMACRTVLANLAVLAVHSALNISAASVAGVWLVV